MELKEFIGSDIPPYSILSHTWGDEEVSFRDMENCAKASQMKGYSKIEQACRLSREQGVEYTWVDTCCINKSSSAELSEALNSMFAWYRDSVICYAYIEDLHDDKSFKDSMQKCKWLTRGWTLQELIAPSKVAFYDANWTYRGDKKYHCDVLSTITKINGDVLNAGISISDLLDTLPVGQKMSWASTRITKRKEDTAYCLLGIFNVNMPLLYGEGSNAFFRLQEEIIKSKNDLSLFAWKAKREPESDLLFRGILAHDVSEFAHCHSLVFNRGGKAASHGEFHMSNSGLRFHPSDDSVDGPYLVEYVDRHNTARTGLDLKCFLDSKYSDDVNLSNKPLCICLYQHGLNMFTRAYPCELGSGQAFISRYRKRPFAVTTGRTSLSQELMLSATYNAIKFTHEKQPEYPDVIVVWHSIVPESRWDDRSRLFLTPPFNRFLGRIVLSLHLWKRRETLQVLILCGAEAEWGRPWYSVKPLESLHAGLEDPTNPERLPFLQSHGERPNLAIVQDSFGDAYEVELKGEYISADLFGHHIPMFEITVTIK